MSYSYALLLVYHFAKAIYIAMIVDLLLLTVLFLYLLLTEASRHVSRSPRDILVELKGEDRICT